MGIAESFEKAFDELIDELDKLSIGAVDVHIDGAIEHSLRITGNVDIKHDKTHITISGEVEKKESIKFDSSLISGISGIFDKLNIDDTDADDSPKLVRDNPSKLIIVTDPDKFNEITDKYKKEVAVNVAKVVYSAADKLHSSIIEKTKELTGEKGIIKLTVSSAP